jgi:hypothetical protein
MALASSEQRAPDQDVRNEGARGAAALAPPCLSHGKIALVHGLLEELVGNTAPDSTVVLSQTLNAVNHCESNNINGLASRLPALLLKGAPLQALHVCQEALRTLPAAVQSGLRTKLSDLRKLLEAELLQHDRVDLVTPDLRFHLIPKRSVLIGRPAENAEVDIAPNCRWFSRGDRHLSLFSEGNNWFVVDLGSRNGSFLDGEALKRGQPKCIPPGTTRIGIGKGNENASPVELQLCRPAKDIGAVVVSLISAVHRTDMADTWPAMEQDVRRRWIVFREQIGISGSGQCALQIDGATANVMAAVRYQRGFWIVPSQQSGLIIDGLDFRENVPLGVGMTVGILDRDLPVDGRQPSTATGVGGAVSFRAEAG